MNTKTLRARTSLHVLLVLGIMLLAACSKDEDTAPGISGEVTIPEGNDIAGTIVRAVFLTEEGTQDLTSPNSQEIIIEDHGTRAAFSFTDLAPGNYNVDASKSIYDPDFDDFFFCHTTDPASRFCAKTTPPVQDIHINMLEVVDYIRQRVSFPSQLAGKRITVLSGTCWLSGGQCDWESENSVVLTYSYILSKETELALHVSNLAYGDYMTVCWVDADGDEEYEYFGCWPDAGECLSVQPGNEGDVYEYTVELQNESITTAELPPGFLRKLSTTSKASQSFPLVTDR